MSRPAHLQADCGRCTGLCCVAPNFEQSETFAYSKPAGDVCRHLTDGNRCGIHDYLAANGFSGCVAYECFGAGQKVSQALYPGRSWRDNPAIAEEMFAVYFMVKSLHELMVYLVEARALCDDSALAKRIDAQVTAYEAATVAGADALAELDVGAEEQTVKALISQIGGAR